PVPNRDLHSFPTRRSSDLDLKHRDFSEGFSTITMQLARNIFPERISNDKTLIRKLKEAKVARAIEDRYPKDKILELYLNQINLGDRKSTRLNSSHVAISYA